MSFPPRPPMVMPGYQFPSVGMMPMRMMPPHLMSTPTVVPNSRQLIPQEIPKEKKPPTTTVFVGNISERAPDAMIKTMLQRCGNVLNWKRVQGASGKLQGFGFCEYEQPEATLRCLRLLNTWKICEKDLLVKVDAKTREKLAEYKKVKEKDETVKTTKDDGDREEGETRDGDDEEDEIDENTKRDDRVAKAGLDAIMKEYAHELGRDPVHEEKKESTRSSRKTEDASLDELGLDDNKKSLINREIQIFRDAHKDDPQEEDDSEKIPKRREDRPHRDDRDRDRHRDREWEREREKDRERDRDRDREIRRSDSDRKSSRRSASRTSERSGGKNDWDRNDRGDRDRLDRGDRSERDRGERNERDRGERTERDRGERSERDRGERTERDRGERTERDRGERTERDRGERTERDRGERTERDRGERTERDRGERTERDRGERSNRERSEQEKQDRDREREKDREREREREREKEKEKIEREKSRAIATVPLEEEDEAEMYERKRNERRLKEKEVAYQTRLQGWETRERKKSREYEKEKEREEERQSEETKEARRLKEFLEDYDDERDDIKFFKGSALQRRLKEREKEMELDQRDRQRETEELEDLRQKLKGQGFPECEVDSHIAELERESESHLKPGLPDRSSESPEIQNGKVSPAARSNSSHSASSDGDNDDYPPAVLSNGGTPPPSHKVPILEFPITATAPPTFPVTRPGSTNSPDGQKRKKMTVSDVFNQDDDETEVKRKRLTPLESTAAKASNEEKIQYIKSLIESIPTAKEQLFSYRLDWSMVDETLMERRIKPWVNKKMVEYIGEEEPSLTGFICKSVMSHCTPQSILSDVSMVLDDEAEVFVIKMWRLLVYETEAKKAGLVK